MDDPFDFPEDDVKSSGLAAGEEDVLGMCFGLPILFLVSVKYLDALNVPLLLIIWMPQTCHLVNQVFVLPRASSPGGCAVVPAIFKIGTRYVVKLTFPLFFIS